MILFHRVYIEYRANLNLHDHSAKSKFRKNIDKKQKWKTYTQRDC